MCIYNVYSTAHQRIAMVTPTYNGIKCVRVIHVVEEKTSSGSTCKGSAGSGTGKGSLVLKVKEIMMVYITS